jgi:hypothetical protein
MCHNRSHGAREASEVMSSQESLGNSKIIQWATHIGPFFVSNLAIAYKLRVLYSDQIPIEMEPLRNFTLLTNRTFTIAACISTNHKPDEKP